MRSLFEVSVEAVYKSSLGKISVRLKGSLGKISTDLHAMPLYEISIRGLLARSLHKLPKRGLLARSKIATTRAI